jgi:hypothetical protein
MPCIRVRANLDWLTRQKQACYIAVVKKNQPLLYGRIKALPWQQVPVGSVTRDTGHGRLETRTLKTAHISGLGFPGARQAIKITRWRQDTATGKTSRETVYAITSLTSAQATPHDLARLVREHWTIEAHHHGCSLGVQTGHEVRLRETCRLEQGTTSPTAASGVAYVARPSSAGL